MEIVLIFNGLGNQMSQYAFYLSKLRYNLKCRAIFDPGSKSSHNGLEIERLFGIELNKSLLSRFFGHFWHKCLVRRKLAKVIRPFGIKTVIEPNTYDYNPKNITDSPAGLTFYWGGWHSEKYFKDIREDILEIFKFPVVKNISECDCRYNKWLETIINDEKSVSVHIRRGDYLSEPKTSPYQYYLCPTEYYKKAIAYFKQRLNKPSFYVFSNDIEWCRQNIGTDDIHYIDCNSGINSWRDMSLMTQCRHHIVANSSFSWWGAWLSKHNGVTIRPEKFLTNAENPDYYPESWIVIK